jgi:exonuclease VII large subunit
MDHQAHFAALYEIIHQKSTKIKQLELKLMEREERKRYHHDITEVEILKILLEKQLRDNKKIENRMKSKELVDVATQMDADDLQTTQSYFEKINHSIQMVFETISQLIESIEPRMRQNLENQGVSQHDRFSFSIGGLLELKNHSIIIAKECAALKKEKKELIDSIKCLHFVHQQAQKIPLNSSSLQFNFDELKQRIGIGSSTKPILFQEIPGHEQIDLQKTYQKYMNQ